MRGTALNSTTNITKFAFCESAPGLHFVTIGASPLSHGRQPRLPPLSGLSQAAPSAVAFVKFLKLAPAGTVAAEQAHARPPAPQREAHPPQPLPPTDWQGLNPNLRLRFLCSSAEQLAIEVVGVREYLRRATAAAAAFGGAHARGAQPAAARRAAVD